MHAKEKKGGVASACLLDCRVVEANQQLKAGSEQGALSSTAVVSMIWPGAKPSAPPDADTSGPPLQSDWGSTAHRKLRARPLCPASHTRACVRTCMHPYAQGLREKELFLDFRLWLPGPQVVADGCVVLVASL